MGLANAAGADKDIMLAATFQDILLQFIEEIIKHFLSAHRSGFKAFPRCDPISKEPYGLIRCSPGC